MQVRSLQEAVRVVAGFGFSLKELSREIGKNEHYLSELTRKSFQPTDATLEKLRSSLKKRGVILVGFNPEKDSLSKLSERSSLLLGRLADRLGVSRQAINAQRISESTLSELVDEIHSIGRKLLKLAA